MYDLNVIFGMCKHTFDELKTNCNYDLRLFLSHNKTPLKGCKKFNLCMWV